jgi:hypothetical protein
MSKIILYHGTSEELAKKIEKEGFVPDKKYNWNVRSKKGFVYLSLAYAPFYAMKHNTQKLALIKVEVDSKDLYPEDDFIMFAMKKPAYSQKDLDDVNLENYKQYWEKSLKFLGNVAVKPDKIKILGIWYFDGKNLIMRCDPCIIPTNFWVMGDYYKELSEWIFQGKEIIDFPSFMSKL